MYIDESISPSHSFYFLIRWPAVDDEEKKKRVTDVGQQLIRFELGKERVARSCSCSRNVGRQLGSKNYSDNENGRVTDEDKVSGLKGECIRMITGCPSGHFFKHMCRSLAVK